MNPTKVTIEITGKEYTTKVYDLDGLVLSDRTMKLHFGGARGTKKGSLEDDLNCEEFDDLVEEIQNIDGYSVAKALQELGVDGDEE